MNQNDYKYRLPAKQAMEDIEDIALKEWEMKEVSAIDKYASIAIRVIGVTGMVSAIVAWMLAGFHFMYAIIFFLGLLFVIGGTAWKPKKLSASEREQLKDRERQYIYEDRTGFRSPWVSRADSKKEAEKKYEESLDDIRKEKTTSS